MKKNYLAICLIIALILGGCKTAKVIQLPTGQKIAVERSISGNTVTLEIAVDNALLDNNEVVIIAEKLPQEASYVDGSANPAPAFNDNSLLAWIFAKNPPQQLGQNAEPINNPIPASIAYSIGSSVSSGFKGKWGLKIANEEGPITAKEAGGGGTPTGKPFDVNSDNTIDDLDLLVFLNKWATGQKYNGQDVDDILILRVLNAWVMQQ